MYEEADCFSLDPEVQGDALVDGPPDAPVVLVTQKHWFRLRFREIAAPSIALWYAPSAHGWRGLRARLEAARRHASVYWFGDLDPAALVTFAGLNGEGELSVPDRSAGLVRYAGVGSPFDGAEVLSDPRLRITMPRTERELWQLLDQHAPWVRAGLRPEAAALLDAGEKVECEAAFGLTRGDAQRDAIEAFLARLASTSGRVAG